jgi:hypothetical protein
MPWGYAIGAVGSIVGGVLSSNATDDAAESQAASEGASLDYQKEVQKLPLQYRDMALGKLGEYYGGDQQTLIDDVKSGDFYQSSLQQGREGVAATASTTGNLRGGNAKLAFYQQDQNTLQNAVSQKIAGLSGLAQTPINTSGIANTYSRIGDNEAQASLTKANITGNTLGTLGGYAMDYYGSKGI